MKTDKFDDAIRRKLESIEPPFRDRDWSHMQTFMHRHGYPPAWSGASQWLGPLATAAAVTGLIVATVWQFRTNQELSLSIQTLNKTVTRLETTQAKLIEHQRQTDTVYVTNFTKTPSTVGTHQPAYVQIPSDPLSAPSGHPYDLRSDQSTAENRQPSARATAPLADLAENRLSLAPTATQNRVAYRRERLTESGADQPAASVVYSAEPANRSVVDLPDRENTTLSSARPATRTGKNRKQSGVVPSANRLSEYRSPGGEGSALFSAPVRRSSGQTYANTSGSGSGSDGRDTRQGSSPGITPPDDRPEATRQIETMARLSIRPVVFDSAYYVESMARRKRRIRSLVPAAIVLPATAMPTDVAGSRPAETDLRFRVGVSGETGAGQRAIGGYGEVIIGKHWSVGVALNKLFRQGGQFGNEEQFYRITHNDFRRLFAPGVDPRNQIIDIDQQFTLWQIPVTLSYRASLGNGFFISPAAGMNFTTSALGKTTFTYWRGIREIPNVASRLDPHPRSWFNTYTVAVNGEKSWKHIVIQAGPVLTVPTRTVPDPVNSVSLGVRGRLLFQF